MKYVNSNASALLHNLKEKSDPVSIRMQRMLQLPDLTHSSNSPVHFIVEAITNIEVLNGYDYVEIPEIVPVELIFDLLGAAKDHPSRSKSDTFYVNDSNVLRSQTTAMWSYYLRDTETIEKLDKYKSVFALCYGKVYRKDEIDRNHYPVFHQIDCLRLGKTSYHTYTIDELGNILVQIAQAVFGKNIEWRLEPDAFPFTTPSTQLLIHWNNQWLEIVGAGLVNPRVLTLLGINPDEYNGWAFGFGLDRIAMIKMNIPDIRILWSNDERITKQFSNIDSKFHDVSKYPPTDRDISFIIDKATSVNEVYNLMRECGYQNNEDLIEEVRQIDTFDNEQRFGAGKISRTFRIRYRSTVRTLTTEEINDIQENLRLLIMKELGAILR